ncbi:CoA ester lyase [Paraburkholderia phymatum]|uniref:HpcH/HpaI aldolase n=1 Tax=Paraburkholderia phymatum (strain DSM 17167 / CIP 108236 / LMG 21445 / STM815) TaxID=391038 RepID=B2JL73_PARP8|nr:CoA ester lyase [Paraburkholderia phymatum]ACC74041.1 HpcH/HpaI aldolase [Paraburkholderia phymatum STM815]
MAARSYLFVPGNRPERFEKAYASGTDAVILDLEDAVATDLKVEARDTVTSWLNAGGRAYVRINARGTEWYQNDVTNLMKCPGLLGIVVPKAEESAALVKISKELSDEAVILPLIESARGFANLQQIACTPRVERLVFGTLDFQVDTGIRGDGDELVYFRSQLTLVSRLAGIAAPVDGVTASLDDGDLLRQETLRARNLGFRGKLCIHPKQVPHVHAAFQPSTEEVDWANRVLTAVNVSKGAVTVVDGKMVDVPVVLKARDIFESAGITT